MTTGYRYDVFLSHATADKDFVREIAVQLRHAGLKVWFDEWVIGIGDDIYLSIESGLEQSRVLALFISDNALGSDWVDLERSTALFRDPRNRDRRFVPVRIDNTDVPDTLARYRYIDLREHKAQGVDLLIGGCRGQISEKEFEEFGRLMGSSKTKPTSAAQSKTLDVDASHLLFKNRKGNVVASAIAGGSILLFLAVIIFVMPEPTLFQRGVLRFFIASCAAMLATFFFGGVVLQGKLAGLKVGAGGGFLLFVLIQFVFDPLKIQTIAADIAPGIVPPRQEVKRAQEALARTGAYVGPVDGIPSSATRNAIKEFQAECGLPATGFVDPATERKFQEVGSTRDFDGAVSDPEVGNVATTAENSAATLQDVEPIPEPLEGIKSGGSEPKSQQVATAEQSAVATGRPMPFATPRLAGMMTDVRLVEFSGMAPARRKNRFWAVNDGGQQPILWQVDRKGKIVAHLRLENLVNIDFEDLASFSLNPPNGPRLHYVAVADIGDNAALQNDHKIYIIADVKGRKAAAPVWTIHFRYPDGAHDAESLAVDADQGYLYIVIKCEPPPILYRLPLRPADSSMQVAERIATLEGLPVNDQNSPDARNAVRYGSRPTGAVIGCDGNELLLLTYASVYRYQKANNQNWATALVGQMPQVLPLPLMFQAEAITLTPDCETLYVGGKKVPGPLWRFARAAKAGN